MDPMPRSVKSVKSRLDTIKQSEEAVKHNVSKVHSHFLVPSDKLDKVTRRVIAPYAQIERKDVKEEAKPGTYLDINRFTVFLEDTVDLDSLLYETANVLKAITNSSGVFVYIVDNIKNEIVLMTQNTKNPERHEVNIPIEEGKIASAHVAYTKEYLVIDDVQRDRRFAEGLKWIDAKVALCMPVIKPDGDCYAVLELYRTTSEPYDHNVIYTVVSVACWAGAAVHQAQVRITLQRTAHLNSELRALLQNYFCDLASIDTMLTDMLAVIKSFIGAMRSSFYIIDRDHIGEHLLADMWDDGWSSEKSTMPRKKVKVNFDYHISDGSKEDMAGLVCYMFVETFADRNFERHQLADFALTVLQCYRHNPYHNAEHAFLFTHTMYLILVNNTGYFDFVETAALMLAGLCHDLDHPGLNNNYLQLSRHPLARMYRTSTLEHHHFFLAKKIIEDKNLLAKLSITDRTRIMTELKYNILCTDLAIYFQLRAQLTPLLAERAFDWTNNSHRRMLKGILMTTSDLSGSCKPFGVAKAIAEAVYAEFYAQGDKERWMGYSPLSMMDRRRSANQPAEQIQFLSVVVIPCLMMLQNVFPNTSVLLDNCRKTQEAWHEEIEIRGQKLWRQEDSVPKPGRGHFQIKTESSSN